MTMHGDGEPSPNGRGGRHGDNDEPPPYGQPLYGQPSHGGAQPADPPPAGPGARSGGGGKGRLGIALAAGAVVVVAVVLVLVFVVFKGDSKGAGSPEAAVRGFYAAAGAGNVDKAEGYLCAADRGDLGSAYAASPSDFSQHNVQDTTIQNVAQQGDIWLVTVHAMIDGQPDTSQYPVVRESGHYLVCPSRITSISDPNLSDLGGVAPSGSSPAPSIPSLSDLSDLLSRLNDLRS
jgi:hypothetical protein